LAEIYNVSRNQTDYVVPPDAAPRIATVTALTEDGESFKADLQVQMIAPALS
jgi:hypothetical protein